MAFFEVRWSSSAERDLRHLDRSHISSLIEAAQSLGGNPFPANSRKIEGAKALFRIRVGDYRIVYEVDKQIRRVTIFHVRHRQSAYRGL